jgi:hypothetical protein
VIESVNDQVPKDASALSDIVANAAAESDIRVLSAGGVKRTLRTHLNSSRPRLGAACDLTGWSKAGITAAGNESITLYEGPYALTASGIVDKGIVFYRVRFSNNFDQPLEFGPTNFIAADAQGTPLLILSPKDVMCYLYGEKGAHLLALKKKHNETMDAHEQIPAMQDNADEHCATGEKGRMTGSDAGYAEANATYMATESLWPARCPPGGVADGLIYTKDTTSLPITLKSTVDGRTFTAQLGLPAASAKQMRRSELIRFFESQKKGNNIRLTLKKGKVFVGKFSLFDAVEERVWFNTPHGGVLNTTSYSVEMIRYAEPLEQIPAKPTASNDHLN